MRRSDDLTREQLDAALDVAEQRHEPDHDLLSSLRYRLRTICETCGREGATDRWDTHGIYAGRWHDRCETPSQRHRRSYRWQPGDEPLDDD